MSQVDAPEISHLEAYDYVPVVPATLADDPIYLIERLLTKLNTFWMRVTYPFPAIGREVAIHHTVDLRRAKAHRIRIGDSVYISRDVWLNITLTPGSDGEAIILGDRCILGRRNMISAKNRVEIEADVMTAPNVLIMDHNHHYEDVTRPVAQQGVTPGGRVLIGEGSFLGYGSCVVASSGELVLGHHCVVAANSVVTRSYPPYSVLSGNPARIVKQYDPVKHAWVLGGHF